MRKFLIAAPIALTLLACPGPPERIKIVNTNEHPSNGLSLCTTAGWRPCGARSTVPSAGANRLNPTAVTHVSGGDLLATEAGQFFFWDGGKELLPIPSGSNGDPNAITSLVQVPSQDVAVLALSGSSVRRIDLDMDSNASGRTPRACGTLSLPNEGRKVRALTTAAIDPKTPSLVALDAEGLSFYEIGRLPETCGDTHGKLARRVQLEAHNALASARALLVVPLPSGVLHVAVATTEAVYAAELGPSATTLKLHFAFAYPGIVALEAYRMEPGQCVVVHSTAPEPHVRAVCADTEEAQCPCAR